MGITAGFVMGSFLGFSGFGVAGGSTSEGNHSGVLGD
jgi:hypothetical protein